MVPVWADICGHIGYAFVALGMYFLAKKNIWGWICRWIGEMIWLVVGALIGMTSMWTWGILFLFIEAYGFYSWRKDLKHEDHSIERP